MSLTSYRYARWIRRAALPLALVAGVYFFWTYGRFKVPEGMDTLPGTYPPGTVCLIEKRPGHLVPGRSVVILELEDGTTLMSRVHDVVGDQVSIRHDNRSSKLAGYEARSYPREQVWGLVLTGFVPDDALQPALPETPPPRPREEGDGR